MAEWSATVKNEVAQHFNNYAGDGIFTFELFHIFQSLLSWGLVVPLPIQLEYPDTPKNRETWKHNVTTFYRAMVANDLKQAAPREYVLMHPIAIPDIPRYVAKKSGLMKALKVVAIVAVICVGAVVVAGAMAGTAAGAAATATGGTSAVATTAATGAGAVASTVTTAAAATATGAAATSAATGITATIAAAAKTAGAWILKTAATASLGNEISKHFQGEIAEEQAKVAARQAEADAARLRADIDAINAEADALARQSATPPPVAGNALLPLTVAVALASFFM